MNRARQIGKNLGWILSARSIELGSAIVVVALTTRYLGVEDFGIYSLVIAIVLVVQPIVILGTSRILIRDIAQNKDRAAKLVGAGMTFSLLMIVPMFLILFIFSFKFSSKEFLALFISVFTVLSISLIRTISTVFLAFERMVYNTILSIATGISFVTLTVCVVYFNLGFIYIFAAMATTNLLGLLFSVLLCKKHFNFLPTPRIDIKCISYIIKESFSIVIFQVLVQLYLYIGVFILKAMTGYVDVGLFQAPYRVFNRFRIIPRSLMLSMFPFFSRLAAATDSKEELKSKTQITFRMMFVVSIVIAIVGVTYAEEIVLILFGREFLKSTIIFRILSIWICFTFLNIFFSSLLIATKRQKNLILIQGAGLISCILLNLLLISQHGYIGPSIAIAVSSFIITALNFYFLFDLFKGALKKTVYYPILGVVPTGAIMYFMRPPTSKFLLLTVEITVYLSMSYLLGVINRKELLSIKARA